ncbi:MAG: hypothetical protein ACRD0U_06040 [Acidimicrobiales bacterium]
MIFRPLDLRRFLWVFRHQGVFVARQEVIARDYGRMMASEVSLRHDR